MVKGNTIKRAVGLMPRALPAVLVSLCVAIVLASCGSKAHRPLLSPLTPYVISASFPSSTNGIHLGLAFDYDAHNAAAISRQIDYIFGGYFVDWNTGIDPAVDHDDAYIPFDFDGFPQNARGHSLADWKAKHPDWIVYQCDRRTPAYFGDGNTAVPLDFSDPAVRAYQFREAATVLEHGASGVVFDNLTFANFENRCGVYRHGVWSPLGYPGRWRDNAKLDGDMLGWLKGMRAQLQSHFPSKTLGINMNLLISGFGHLRAVTPNIDMLFDEAGFTAYGGQNLASTNWQREVQALDYLTAQGKAWDVNGIVPADRDSEVTPEEINWVLANYLLVKGPHSYTYIYAGAHRGFSGSPSGYGTFYDRPEYHIPIGRPLSNRFSSSGVEMRYYSGGLVIVNPSSWQSFPVALGGTYQDMFGHTYTALTLAPTSGIVLLREH